eukprot:9501386-Pyramimonas_sp.AAC.1
MVCEMSSDRALYQLSRLRLAVPHNKGWQRRRRFASPNAWCSPSSGGEGGGNDPRSTCTVSGTPSCWT